MCPVQFLGDERLPTKIHLLGPLHPVSPALRLAPLNPLERHINTRTQTRAPRGGEERRGAECAEKNAIEVGREVQRQQGR